MKEFKAENHSSFISEETVDKVKDLTSKRLNELSMSFEQYVNSGYSVYPFYFNFITEDLSLSSVRLEIDLHYKDMTFKLNNGQAIYSNITDEAVDLIKSNKENILNGNFSCFNKVLESVESQQSKDFCENAANIINLDNFDISEIIVR